MERWAREVIRRLVALDPERYAVARPPRALVHRAGHVWEQIALPARARRQRASLIFCPANLAPLAWPRNVVVIHDAAALRDPRWYSPSYVAWQRWALPRIARRACHVVTVSEFSRRELKELLAVPDDRLTVIAGGVGERFAATADPRPAAAMLGLAHPYVLTVANETARKNLTALELAARVLAARGVELVAVGGERPQFRAPHSGTSRVRRLGQVPDDLLISVYAGALAFVLPSLYEGFALTCLEAMASGVPVVTADRGALQETCAGASLLVDPDDHHAIAAALERPIDDEALRAQLRAAGLERAAQFTWERTATNTHELIARLA